MISGTWCPEGHARIISSVNPMPVKQGTLVSALARWRHCAASSRKNSMSRTRLPEPQFDDVTDKLEAAIAALRPVGGVQDIQVVGALADVLVAHLDLKTAARSVWMHQDVVQHIQEQRTHTDAAFVLEHMASVVFRPDWAGWDSGDHRRHILVKAVARRLVFVAIKCVSAELARSANDEIWVSTSWVTNPDSLTRKRWARTLMVVPWEGED